MGEPTAPSFANRLLESIAEIGRDPVRGGYSRHVWDPAERELRDWFIEAAARLRLDVETDRNGNIWAWWGAPGPNAVVTGSHLDSVPGGGLYDGPLGVVSALQAVDVLSRDGFVPSRPFAIVVFAEEEGARFGVACLGSRLLTGVLNPERAKALTDRDGITFESAAAGSGFNAGPLGPEPQRVQDIALFIELHIEQGRALAALPNAPVGLASSILAHGRWRLSISGQGNHAGATPMLGRRDPIVAGASAILAVRDAGLASEGGRATVGRFEAIPGGTNVIASAATVWVDARAESDEQARHLAAEIERLSVRAAHEHDCEALFVEESWSGTVGFDAGLILRLQGVLGEIPVIGTGAGHDAGILASVVPSAMIFVRNPTGISHSPEEYASAEDCDAGGAALTAVLRSLL